MQADSIFDETKRKSKLKCIHESKIKQIIPQHGKNGTLSVPFLPRFPWSPVLQLIIMFFSDSVLVKISNRQPH